jgi:hypothetical protein
VDVYELFFNRKPKQEEVLKISLPKLKFHIEPLRQNAAIGQNMRFDCPFNNVKTISSKDISDFHLHKP